MGLIFIGWWWTSEKAATCVSRFGMLFSQLCVVQVGNLDLAEVEFFYGFFFHD